MPDAAEDVTQAIDAITTALTVNQGADPEWTAMAIMFELARLGWRRPAGEPRQARAKLENRP
jgi:hypothetical protein